MPVQIDPQRMGAFAGGTEFEGRMPPIHGIRKDKAKRTADLPASGYAAMLRPYPS
jgi:hypothetical protein